METIKKTNPFITKINLLFSPRRQIKSISNTDKEYLVLYSFNVKYCVIAAYCRKHTDVKVMWINKRRVFKELLLNILRLLIILKWKIKWPPIQ